MLTVLRQSIVTTSFEIVDYLDLTLVVLKYGKCRK